MLWLLLGKLPVIIANIWLTWVSSKRMGWFIAVMATLIMWSTLAVGIFVLPSIIGALVMAVIAHTLTLRHFISKELGVPRHSAGALTLAFGLIMMIGRWGCWLSSCCFGTHYEGVLAAKYEIGSRAHLHYQELNVLESTQEVVTVHAVQLYESFGIAVALIICGYLFTKRYLSEVQASLSFVGLYFLLRALIDPFRAEVNTPTSVDYWSCFGLELSVFQWACLLLASLLTVIVYYARDDQDTQVQKRESITAPSPDLDSPKLLYTTWMIWACSWLMLWLSADYGTPFSHLLSLFSAWGLAALFMTVLYRVLRQSVSRSIPYSDFAFRSKYQLLPICLFLALIFGLASQNVSQMMSHAYPELNLSAQEHTSSLDQSDLEQAWVYTLDPLSKKRVRFARWSEMSQSSLINPYSEVTEQHLSDYSVEHDTDDLGSLPLSAQRKKSKKVKKLSKPRLRLKLVGGDFIVARETGCNGRSIYRVQPIGGTVDLSIFQTRDSNSFLSYSIHRIKSLNVGDEYVNDNEKTRFMHTAQLKIESKYFKGGFGFSFDAEDAMLPIVYVGAGFNTLTPTQGSQVMFEVGLGSGLEDLYPSELIDIYIAVKTRLRLGLHKDLVLGISKPMVFTGENTFIGTGFSYQKVEFVLQIAIGSEATMPALASLRLGF